MASLNSVAIVGRVTRDADLSVGKSGTTYSKFSIAVDDGWGGDKHTSFFDVVVFGKTAEALSQYLVKGKEVGVSGSLKQERWESQEGNRSKVTINAREIQLLRDAGGRAGSGDSKPARSKPASEDRYDFDDDVPF